MHPLRSRNVPLGVHVPQFGNPCTKATNKKMTAGKASRSTSYHKKKNKHYLALIKKVKYMGMILDKCDNNRRIRGAILISINSCHTATSGLKIILKLHTASTSLVYVGEFELISRRGQYSSHQLQGLLLKPMIISNIIDASPLLDCRKATRLRFLA